MAYGKSPTTCIHQVVLSLCVGSCLVLAALPKPVTVQQEIQTAKVARSIVQVLVSQVTGVQSTPDPNPALQLDTTASTRGSWPRKMLLSPNN